MRAVPVALISMVAIVACTPDEGTSSTETTTVAVVVPEVTVPPERLTPFCQAMIDLEQDLPDDPSIDTREQTLVAYQDALPVVPAEIEVEFRAVIAALESGTRATVPAEGEGATVDDASTPVPPSTPASQRGATTLPSDEQLYVEEGWLPDDDPAIRVNEYIEFACRNTLNNPGPPATVPDAIPPTSTEG